jgi:hypothetical protein
LSLKRVHQFLLLLSCILGETVVVWVVTYASWNIKWPLIFGNSFQPNLLLSDTSDRLIYLASLPLFSKHTLPPVHVNFLCLSMCLSQSSSYCSAHPLDFILLRVCFDSQLCTEKPILAETLRDIQRPIQTVAEVPLVITSLSLSLSYVLLQYSVWYCVDSATDIFIMSPRN